MEKIKQQWENNNTVQLDMYSADLYTTSERLMFLASLPGLSALLATNSDPSIPQIDVVSREEKTSPEKMVRRLLFLASIMPHYTRVCAIKEGQKLPNNSISYDKLRDAVTASRIIATQMEK